MMNGLAIEFAAKAASVVLMFEVMVPARELAPELFIERYESALSKTLRLNIELYGAC